MKNQAKDEKLEDIVTDLDPPYETMEDLKVGRLLDQYGIPFFYQQATIVYDQGKNEMWYPTFTLLTYDGLVIDCVRDGAQGPQNTMPQRKQVYDRNQIPAVVLNPEDLNKPNWGRLLYDKVRQTYRQHAEQMGYAPSHDYDADRQPLDPTRYSGAPTRQ